MKIKSLQDFITFYEKCYSKKCPKGWRHGQFIFNTIDSHFPNLARIIQFEDKVDCFYQDDLVVPFLTKAYERLKGFCNIEDLDFPDYDKEK